MTLQRTGEDWRALCAEAGRLYGETVTMARILAEREAELQDLRKQLAASQDELQRPPDHEPEAAP